jgi:hypothetical protein
MHLQHKNSGLQHFTQKNLENIPFLTRKIQKNKFCASFQFYFLHVFLVSENLIF